MPILSIDRLRLGMRGLTTAANAPGAGDLVAFLAGPRAATLLGLELDRFEAKAELWAMLAAG
jgi:hypothetical protein